MEAHFAAGAKDAKTEELRALLAMESVFNSGSRILEVVVWIVVVGVRAVHVMVF